MRGAVAFFTTGFSSKQTKRCCTALHVSVPAFYETNCTNSLGWHSSMCGDICKLSFNSARGGFAFDLYSKAGFILLLFHGIYSDVLIESTLEYFDFDEEKLWLIMEYLQVRHCIPADIIDLWVFFRHQTSIKRYKCYEIIWTSNSWCDVKFIMATKFIDQPHQYCCLCKTLLYVSWPCNMIMQSYQLGLTCDL